MTMAMVEGQIKRVMLVRFKSLLINSAKIADDNTCEDHLFSIVTFDMNLDGVIHEGLTANLRQPYGTDYATEPIEFAPPNTSNYQGHFPFQAFTTVAEEYCHEILGSKGGIINLDSCKNGTLVGVTLQVDSELYGLEMPDQDAPSGGWHTDKPRRWNKAPKKA